MIFDNNIILIGERGYRKEDVYRFIGRDLNQNILYVGHKVMLTGISTSSIHEFKMDKIKKNLFNIDYIVFGVDWQEDWILQNLSEIIKLGKKVILDYDREPKYDLTDFFEVYNVTEYVKESYYSVSFGQIKNHGIMLNGVKFDDIILSYKRMEKLKKLE